MLSNKFGAIAGAAMLGTAALLGTNAAYAIIDLGDAEPRDDRQRSHTPRRLVTRPMRVRSRATAASTTTLHEGHLFRAPKYLVGDSRSGRRLDCRGGSSRGMVSRTAGLARWAVATCNRCEGQGLAILATALLLHDDDRADTVPTVVIR